MPSLKISTAQKQFLISEKKGVIFEGGIGSGKTQVLCIKAILKCLQGRKFCLVSTAFPTLRDVIIPTTTSILEQMDLKQGVDWTLNKGDMIFHIAGTDLLMRSGERPDSLRSLNVADFGLDEARNFKDKYLFDILLGRIRTEENSQWFLSTTTKGRNWVYKLRQKYPAERLEHVIQTTYGNPFLPKDYLRELELQYTSEYLRQELLAEIVEFGGGILRSEWFQEIAYLKPKQSIRFWDVAVSIKTSADRSAGALCSKNNDKFIIHDIISDRWEYPDLRKKIIETAKRDGVETVIGVEQAGQQLGFIDDLKQIPELTLYTIKGIKPRGDKLSRALPWGSRAESGKVEVCIGKWNDDFYDEVNQFSADDSHDHDDRIDAVSGCYQYLNTRYEAVSARIAF